MLTYANAIRREEEGVRESVRGGRLRGSDIHGLRQLCVARQFANTFPSLCHEHLARISNGR